jgi:hypothetical protein
VSFREVVHSALTGNSEVAKPPAIRGELNGHPQKCTLTPKRSRGYGAVCDRWRAEQAARQFNTTPKTVAKWRSATILMRGPRSFIVARQNRRLGQGSNAPTGDCGRWLDQQRVDRRRPLAGSAGAKSNTSSAPSASWAFQSVIWFGCTSYSCAGSASVLSLLMAASATFTLKAGYVSGAIVLSCLLLICGILAPLGQIFHLSSCPIYQANSFLDPAPGAQAQPPREVRAKQLHSDIDSKAQKHFIKNTSSVGVVSSRC